MIAERQLIIIGPALGGGHHAEVIAHRRLLHIFVGAFS